MALASNFLIAANDEHGLNPPTAGKRTPIMPYINRSFYENEFKNLGAEVYVTTVDGSYGTKGFVTDVLKDLLAKESYDLVIAIGPVGMMKAIAEITRSYGIKTIVSLNPIMIDGTGMCGGCRVNVGGQVKFACVDGPDFDAHQVDFDELMLRNTYYKREEAHACRMGGFN